MKNKFSHEEMKTSEIKNIIFLIENELEGALHKHPKFPCDPVRAVAIMAEEAGEAIQAANDWVYIEDGGGPPYELETELLQTAATCIRILKGIETGDIKP